MGARRTDIDIETDRLAEVYGRYRRSSRKRRAWAAENPGNTAIRAELTDALLADSAPFRAVAGGVLDIGCGTGWALRAFASAGDAPDRLEGVDLLADRVEAAQQALPGSRVQRADARALPFPDEAFGVVLLLTVLSSIPDPVQRGRVLSEAGRVLARNGAVLLYEPRLPNPLNHSTQLPRLAEAHGAGLVHARTKTLTVLPPLVRRLPRSALVRAYPLLARIHALRTHRLTVLRRSGARAPRG